MRLDVFARGDGRVYDIEMQVARERDLGRRMRYYQAAMDVGELGSGEDFGALPESYVLFFCRHDAYGKGEPAYVIERRCGAHPDLAVGDASPWVVLNASAWEASADPGLRDVLRYLRTGEAEGPLSSEIDALVGVFNEDREWVDRVLTYEQETEMRCRRAREEGIELGREEGAGAVGALMAALLDAGGRSGGRSGGRRGPSRRARGRSAGRRPFRRRGRCGGGQGASRGALRRARNMRPTRLYRAHYA